MAIRYIANSAFSPRRGKVYTPNYRQPDGTPGYLWEEIEGLDKAGRANFKQWHISGAGVVEEATAAPGEKRDIPSHECSEEDCDFTSRTAAGIAAHERSHK